MTVSEAYNTLLALSRANKPYSSAEESIISNLYTEVTGKKVRDCNCRDKWHDAVIEALLYIKKNNARKSIQTTILQIRLPRSFYKSTLTQGVDLRLFRSQRLKPSQNNERRNNYEC